LLYPGRGFVTRARLQPGHSTRQEKIGASQAAEKLFLYRKAKNRSRQEALRAIAFGFLTSAGSGLKGHGFIRAAKDM
jgi:hypothetical protein